MVNRRHEPTPDISRFMLFKIPPATRKGTLGGELTGWISCLMEALAKGRLRQESTEGGRQNKSTSDISRFMLCKIPSVNYQPGGEES